MPAHPTIVAASTLNSGDTAWMLVSTALVLLHVDSGTGALRGMVRRKNVLAT